MDTILRSAHLKALGLPGGRQLKPRRRRSFGGKEAEWLHKESRFSLSTARSVIVFLVVLCGLASNNALTQETEIPPEIYTQIQNALPGEADLPGVYTWKLARSEAGINSNDLYRGYFIQWDSNRSQEPWLIVYCDIRAFEPKWGLPPGKDSPYYELDMPNYEPWADLPGAYRLSQNSSDRRNCNIVFWNRDGSISVSVYIGGTTDNPRPDAERLAKLVYSRLPERFYSLKSGKNSTVPGFDPPGISIGLSSVPRDGNEEAGIGSAQGNSPEGPEPTDENTQAITALATLATAGITLLGAGLMMLGTGVTPRDVFDGLRDWVAGSSPEPVPEPSAIPGGHEPPPLPDPAEVRYREQVRLLQEDLERQRDLIDRERQRLKQYEGAGLEELLAGTRERIREHETLAELNRSELARLNEDRHAHSIEEHRDLEADATWRRRSRDLIRDLNESDRNLEAGRESIAEGESEIRQLEEEELMREKMNELEKRMQSTINEKIHEGYYVRNSNLLKKAWNNSLGYAVEKAGGWKGGQCGEFGQWGADWSKNDVQGLFGENAVVTDIAASNNPFLGHRATKVILPDGRRVVLDFWESLPEGKPKIYDEEQWIERWNDKLWGNSLGKVSINRHEDELNLKSLIRDWGEEAGKEKFRLYNAKRKGRDYAETFIRSWERKPW